MIHHILLGVLIYWCVDILCVIMSLHLTRRDVMLL